MSILELNDVHAYYGKIHALKGISLKVEKGEIVTLIGGNGAGKTTTLRTISALMRPTTGSVTFEDESLTRYKPSDLAARGIAMVPEGRGVFARMTVLENLEMGAFHRNDKAGIAQDVEMVYDLFPRLKERRTQLAGTMSGGEQQMLAIARILRTGARLLLLDEPTEGLAPVIVQQIGSVVRQLKERGFTVLLVEQNFRFASKLADRHYVVENGKVIDTLDANDVAANAERIQKYLKV